MERGGKFLLKDTEEANWVPTLHDIDPEKMELLMEKFRKDQEKREAYARTRLPGDHGFSSRPNSSNVPGSEDQEPESPNAEE